MFVFIEVTECEYAFDVFLEILHIFSQVYLAELPHYVI